MNYKNSKHYNDVLRVFSGNSSFEDVDINKVEENSTNVEIKLPQQEMIVRAVSEMDFDKLRVLIENTLEDDEIYLFLNEIAPEFKKFKENGDSYLITDSGLCCSSSCDNFKCCGYSFTGNNSKNFYSLIFKKEGGIIKDICECQNFQLDDAFLNKKRLKAKKEEFDSYDITDSELDEIPF